MNASHFFILGIFLSSLSACQNSTVSEVEGFEQTPSGLYYKMHKKGQGINPPFQIGDELSGHFWQYWGDVLIQESPLAAMIEEPLFKGDISDGFLMLNIGDSITFALPADSVVKFWGIQRPTEFFLCDYFKMTVRIDNVIKKAFFDSLEIQKQAEQDLVIEVSKPGELKRLQAYIEKNNITEKPNNDGVYVIVRKKGRGEKVAPGKTVVFDWTGRLLNGVVWDSSNEDIAGDAGVAFPQRAYEPKQLKIGENQWMIGLDNALLGQTAGSKLRIILPSNMVFGYLGNAFVDEFQSVILDIELLEVK